MTKIGVALVGVNKPTQQYGAVAPFDALSLKMAEHAMGANLVALGTSAISDYLALTQRDNERYGGDSGVRRRAQQLSSICKVLLPQGHLDEVLRYAAMRQSVFEMGLDTANDSVAGQILSGLTAMKDRSQAYDLLADWTFEGDGPLRVLGALVGRPRLPDWIPESVSGDYPMFASVVTDDFPIVTNWYSLAEFAAEVGKTDALLDRLRIAHQKERHGASEALAIALATFEQPVPKELLEQIEQRMVATAPEESNFKAAMPLPTMQLATMLASNADQEEWSQRIAENFAIHATRRRYPLPWLFRYQFRQGWSEAADLRDAKSLVHWLDASLTGSKRYADNHPAPQWLTDGKSQINHLCGIGNEAMWFRYPLSGDFEFQVELIDGGWRESSILASGIRFGGSGYWKWIDVATNSQRDWARFPTKAVTLGEWNKYRVRYKGDQLEYFVNDKQFYSESRPAGPTWVGLRAPSTQYTGARNIRFVGEPRIPRSIALISDDRMRGWSGQYYSQPLPTAVINSKTHEPDAEAARSIRTAPAVAQSSDLSWTVQDGEIVSGDSTTRGPGGQSVIRYDRPLAAGETISYEFFWTSGDSEVHPSIGRTAYLLRADGVRLHWMTEADSAWKTPDDYEVPANAAATELPLHENDWNRLELRRIDGQIQIRLNDVIVMKRPFVRERQGAIFGLFHYASETKARVRNVQLSGPWPETLPGDLLMTRPL